VLGMYNLGTHCQQCRNWELLRRYDCKWNACHALYGSSPIWRVSSSAASLF
jgi:hypothetical protein